MSWTEKSPADLVPVTITHRPAVPSRWQYWLAIDFVGASEVEELCGVETSGLPPARFDLPCDDDVTHGTLSYDANLLVTD